MWKKFSYTRASHLHARECRRSRWRGRVMAWCTPELQNPGRIPWCVGPAVDFFLAPTSQIRLDPQAGDLDESRAHFERSPRTTSLGVLASPRFITAPRGRRSQVWMLEGARWELGANVMIQPGLDLSLGANAVLRVEANSYFSADVTLYAKTSVTIGAGSMIGQRVLIMDYDGHPLVPAATSTELPELPELSGGQSRGITIGKNVWVGHGATLLKGVTIGDGAIVGASACVTKDIPPNTIVAGNPARVIREGWTWRR